MQIIPVIDLKDHHVVHAVKGNRAEYVPVRSSLCKEPDIDRVIEAFLSLYDFKMFYIADLNAITACESVHQSFLLDVFRRYPDRQFWVDSGNHAVQRYFQGFANYLPVIGSESLIDDDVEHIERLSEDFVLSLDYSANGRLGSSLIFDNPKLWPNAIIIMTLAQVGSELGPDFAKLDYYCREFPEKRIIAAGGIRHKQDLVELQKIGVNDVLIASALHSGALSENDIKQIANNEFE
ncbi:HisA/HisF-related TIM barrel protein [Methylotuvimicrobium alcaliphilum]|uniref:Histidine biosynthesis protein n=1 Tax=Methylotuvimicrobium alcaliphilum (strain DSM 19304 / NCIMB 14124 / VKM B-2133 / 20Z) TaxID=1091494 RepID=G4SVQ3_META2|nr:HisA/HisF-related TIM barrel protein [Methylotuvimicrobium alcaliphilum]CCE24112.1 Histidine biosynthesis protein [Methylotuvimicrobium alcaliphilum 20Z]